MKLREEEVADDLPGPDAEIEQNIRLVPITWPCPACDQINTSELQLSFIFIPLRQDAVLTSISPEDEQLQYRINKCGCGFRSYVESYEPTCSRGELIEFIRSSLPGFLEGRKPRALSTDYYAAALIAEFAGADNLYLADIYIKAARAAFDPEYDLEAARFYRLAAIREYKAVFDSRRDSTVQITEHKRIEIGATITAEYAWMGDEEHYWIWRQKTERLILKQKRDAEELLRRFRTEVPFISKKDGVKVPVEEEILR